MSIKGYIRMSSSAYKVRLVSLLSLGVTMWGCLNPAAAQSTDSGFDFDKHEIVIGVAKRQTVLTGFLLGSDVAEVAVVNSDARRLRIYAFRDDSWMPKLNTTLRDEVLFVDMANIGGRDRLITYESGRLSWFDPESATESTLVAVTSNFNPPRKSEIPHVDVTHDLNGDGRDDLVVPDVDGFRVFIQKKGGAFADPVMIGTSTDMSRICGADGYRYDPWSQSRVHEIDYNQDGRNDLVFWNEDHFGVYTQDNSGSFAAEAKTFVTDVVFDSDDLSSLAAGDMTGRVLHSLGDLNGDGVGDLVVYSLEGHRVPDKRSTYEVHYGKPTPDGGTTFASEAGSTFQSDSKILLGMDRHDFDGDGRMDVMLTTVEVRFLSGSLWKNIRGMMGDDIWLNLEFYRNEGGRYPNEPNAIRRIALDGAPSHREPGAVSLGIVLLGAKHQKRKTQKAWPRAFNMLLLVGDVTGDSRLDLFIGKNSPNGLDVIVGVPGANLFARRPQDVPVVVPNDEEHAWLVDLNKDGKQDVLMHHPFTLRDVHGGRKQPPGTEPHRITILITR